MAIHATDSLDQFDLAICVGGPDAGSKLEPARLQTTDWTETGDDAQTAPGNLPKNTQQTGDRDLSLRTVDLHHL